MSSRCKNKQCSKGKVCNPPTGRCVMANGKIGMHIVKVRSRSRSRSKHRSKHRLIKKSSASKCADKKCSIGKVCNPKTGRCVMAKGKIGMQIVKVRSRSSPKARSPKVRSRSSPKVRSRASPKARSPKAKQSVKGNERILKKYGKVVMPYIKEYKSFTFLGKGGFGEVYKACKHNGQCDAVKFMNIGWFDEELFVKEYNMGLKFASLDIGPKLYSMDLVQYDNKKVGIIKMELLSGVLEDLLKDVTDKNVIDHIIKSLVKLINKMCQHDLIHGDLHANNVGYNLEKKNGKTVPVYKLIDYGWACCEYNETMCNPKLEYEQLIRSASFPGKKMDTEMYIYYLQSLHNTYIDNFGGKRVNILTRKDADELCKRFDSIHIKNFRHYEKYVYKKDI